jgi:hypothetical protein
VTRSVVSIKNRDELLQLPEPPENFGGVRRVVTLKPSTNRVTFHCRTPHELQQRADLRYNRVNLTTGSVTSGGGSSSTLDTNAGAANPPITAAQASTAADFFHRRGSGFRNSASS